MGEEPSITEFGVKKRPWKVYRTCTFQGLGSEKQAYIRLVDEGMVKLGFKRAIEWGERILALDGSDLIFKSHDEKFLTGIRVVSTEDGNLKVGYTLAGVPGKAAKILVFSIGFASILGVLSAYIIRQMFGPVAKDIPWVGIIVMIIPLSGFLVPLLAYSAPSKIGCNRKIRQLLVETAESMGSKQITPFSSYFKLTTVDLED